MQETLSNIVLAERSTHHKKHLKVREGGQVGEKKESRAEIRMQNMTWGWQKKERDRTLAKEQHNFGWVGGLQMTKAEVWVAETL